MHVTSLQPLMSVGQLPGKDADPAQEGVMLREIKESNSSISSAAVELIASTSKESGVGRHVDTYA